MKNNNKINKTNRNCYWPRNLSSHAQVPASRIYRSPRLQWGVIFAKQSLDRLAVYVQRGLVLGYTNSHFVPGLIEELRGRLKHSL